MSSSNRGVVNLFDILERGDRKIKTIKQQLILLVGLTKSGKTTVFNWKLGIKMIGR